MTHRIWAALAAMAVFAAVSASAATLGGITSQDVGADNVTVVSCDTDGVTTNFATAYDSTTAAYEVTTVTVGSIADTCNGLTMKVTLSGAANASLAEQTVTVAVDSTAMTPDTSDVVNFSTNDIAAENVTGIHVSIVG
jgi:hypothetical protein